MNQVQLILHQKFLELKTRNPRASHRFFAQRLGISSGALSEILKGKRKVSAKLAAQLAARLQLDPTTAAAFLGNSSPSEELPTPEYLKLSDDQFHLISEWPHFAILNLVKSEFCIHQATWFAEHLNLPLRVAQDALDRLLRLGMLTYQKKRFVRSQPHFTTSDDILNVSIQKSHLADLEMIRHHLLNTEIDQRDLSSISFLLSPDRMPEFKAVIRKFQDQFSNKFETSRSKNPYRLTIALYPLQFSQRKGAL